MQSHLDLSHRLLQGRASSVVSTLRRLFAMVGTAVDRFTAWDLEVIRCLMSAAWENCPALVRPFATLLVLCVHIQTIPFNSAQVTLFSFKADLFKTLMMMVYKKWLENKFCSSLKCKCLLDSHPQSASWIFLEKLRYITIWSPSSSVVVLNCILSDLSFRLLYWQNISSTTPTFFPATGGWLNWELELVSLESSLPSWASSTLALFAMGNLLALEVNFWVCTLICAI